MAKKLNLQCFNQLVELLTFEDKQKFILELGKNIYRVFVLNKVYDIYATKEEILTQISKLDFFRNSYIQEDGLLDVYVFKI